MVPKDVFAEIKNLNVKVDLDAHGQQAGMVGCFGLGEM